MKSLLLAAAGVVLHAVPASASVDPVKAAAGLQAMRELNLIVFQDLQSGHEVEGKADHAARLRRDRFADPPPAGQGACAAA